MEGTVCDLDLDEGIVCDQGTLILMKEMLATTILMKKLSATLILMKELPGTKGILNLDLDGRYCL